MIERLKIQGGEEQAGKRASGRHLSTKSIFFGGGASGFAPTYLISAHQHHALQRYVIANELDQSYVVQTERV